MRDMTKAIRDAIEAKRARIDDLQAEAEVLIDELMTLESALEIMLQAYEPVMLELEEPVPRVKRKRLKGRYRGSMPLGDAIEQVLRDVGRPMHKVHEIAPALDAMKIPYTKHSLDSALRKDHKGRFQGVGGGAFTLRESIQQERLLLTEGD